MLQAMNFLLLNQGRWWILTPTFAKLLLPPSETSHSALAILFSGCSVAFVLSFRLWHLKSSHSAIDIKSGLILTPNNS